MTLHHLATVLDILGDNVATKRNHSRVANDVILEYCDVGRTTTNVYQTDTCFFLFRCQHCRTGSQRLQNQLRYFQTSPYYTFVDIVGGSSLSRYDVEVAFQAYTRHSHWVQNSVLSIYGVFLRKYVDDFGSRLSSDFEHILMQTIDIVLRDFKIGVIEGNDSFMLHRSHVLTSNADMNHFDLNSRMLFRFRHCFADRLDSFVNIHDHSTAHTVGMGFTNTQNVDFAVLIALSNDRANLCRADV